MVTAIIFAAHLIFMLVVFTKKWQEDSLSTGLLNLSLIVILFSVGWAFTGMLAKAVMEQKGLGLYFDRDAFSLTLLTVLEFLFYRYFYDSILKTKESQKS